MMARSGPALPGNRWDLAPAPSEDVSTSVVVTHYEQPVQLARTLRALTSQRDVGVLEVLVSDDGSRAAPRVPPGVRLIRQRHDGFGAGRARNAGARAATGSVLVFLDADTTPEPGFVEAVTRLPRALAEAVVVGRRRHADLARAAPDDEVSVVGPRHELPEPSWLRRGYRETDDLLRADETSFRFVISSVLACGAGLFAETGGFDESFTAYGGEDWEWAHRAWTHGALLAHAPDAVAWHDGPDLGGRVETRARERLSAETLAIARRIPVPGVAPTGLLTPGAPDPVVTVSSGISGDALVIAVDSVLTALPRAAVLLTPAQLAVLPTDPRLGPLSGVLHEAEAARSAWRHLHLRRAVTGPAPAWTSGGALVAGPGAPGRVEVVGTEGAVVADWTTLRAERRTVRWGRALDTKVTATAELAAVPEVLSTQARWGGWGEDWAQ